MTPDPDFAMDGDEMLDYPACEECGRRPAFRCGELWLCALHEWELYEGDNLNNYDANDGTEGSG